MKIKYKEKQAEDKFLKEQKRVEEKFEDLNRRNLEYMEQSKLNFLRIQENDKRIIDNNKSLKQTEQENLKKLEDNRLSIEEDIKVAENKLREKE